MITQRRVRSPQHPAGRRRGAPGGCRAGPRAAGWPPAVVSGTSVIENGVAVPPRTGVPIIVHSSPWTFTPLPMVSATREWKTRSPYVGLSRKSWRTEVQINILGPLEAIVGGESIVPSATKPRKVLALLIANANHVVPISKLKFEIWDDNPPISASTTLQTYVLQLRKLIGNAVRGCPTEAKDILVTRPNGYMFRAGLGQLDVERYEQLAQQGNESLFLGDTETAARQLREALSLWRGSALADVELGQLLQAHVIRLKESRLHTLERRIEAELRLGNHQALLSELAVLVVEEPFNETFRQLRALLIEEIGLEPSPRMYRLQQAMLTADPALDEAPRLPVHSFAAA